MAQNTPPDAPHWLQEWWAQILFALGLLSYAARQAAHNFIIGPALEQKRLATKVDTLTGAVERACSTADTQARTIDRHSDAIDGLTRRIDELLQHMLDQRAH